MSDEVKRSLGEPERVRPVSHLLRDLRSLRVCVFHPNDHDGAQLTQQLQRIGCQVQAFWPPLPAPPEGSDVVFVALFPDMLNLAYDWCAAEDAPPSIAVINYENPTVIEAVLRIGAKAVVASPIRSFGLLSALVVGREIGAHTKKLKRRVLRLEEKLGGARKIADAQDILCRQRGVDKTEAYRIIREQAMAKRMTVEEIASAIINANDILSFGW
ncbi:MULTISPECIES: ANTAR domain-containing response regulator [Paraburkholderia]|uniref:ANTAR domain-containing response regulator n=1 Tax=Paraburkholderia TaxID=1822464 RepID=UPI00037E9033|nr:MULTISPECIES: ANTAR domain-containing protein [Paraburkholderia]MDH6153380.1 AmiR/NasT family two-component response regulator [Paraburkholderia sp. WSM4179]